MMDAFERLTGVLDHERGTLEALLTVAHCENRALELGDHDTFLACVRDQERLLTKMHELERDRALAAGELAAKVGAGASASLLEMCDGLPAELGDRGRVLHDEISKLARELAEVNAENDVLVRQALHTTQHSIALLAGIAEQDARKETYAPAGHGRSRHAAVLDRQA